LGKTHTVVEIGANDGLHMSNSRFFDLQLGWRSLCVEANPQVYKRLQVNRPDCINVNALVGRSSDFNGSSSVPYISFYRPPGKEKQRGSDWETGLSGVESTYATNNEIISLRKAQGFAKRAGLQVERDLLPVVPFSQLFAKHGIDKIDLLSIDVEGAENAVVQSIDFLAVKIGLIVIEKPSQLVTALLRRNQFSPLDIVTGGADQFFLNKRWQENSLKARQVSADTPAAAGPGRGGRAGSRVPTTVTVGPWSWQLDATREELGVGVIAVAVAFGAVLIACACVLLSTLLGTPRRAPLPYRSATRRTFTWATRSRSSPSNFVSTG
jgi:FkbM family methyltransferase